MPSRSLYRSPARVSNERREPDILVRNVAGGRAYQLEPKQALAQLAVTGMMGSTYVANVTEQRDQILALAGQVEPAFLAKAAVYAAEQGFMREAPALMLAVLRNRDTTLFLQTFPRVVRSGRTLRSVAQILRSGVAGPHRNLSASVVRQAFFGWFQSHRVEAIFAASVGDEGMSLRDIVRMTRPAPLTMTQSALYRWIAGREPGDVAFPDVIQRYERLKFRARDGEISITSDEIRGIPFEYLLSLPLNLEGWKAVARQATFNQLRNNLNTFTRKGVFSDKSVLDYVGHKLASMEEVRTSRSFPYQLFNAMRYLDPGVPEQIRFGLEAAMEQAVQNTPVLTDGRLLIFLDVSGSMEHLISQREGVRTTVRCIDVASLMASTMLRRHDNAEIVLFNGGVKQVGVGPHRDTGISQLTRYLTEQLGGSTSIAAPFQWANQHGDPAKQIVVVSDNQSWHEAQTGPTTATGVAWNEYKRRVPGAKVAFIDITPDRTAQLQSDRSVLNVGGFSDTVFSVIAGFAESDGGENYWTSVVDSVAL